MKKEKIFALTVVAVVVIMLILLFMSLTSRNDDWLEPSNMGACTTEIMPADNDLGIPPGPITSCP